MKTIVGVRVPDEVDERLENLARMTGRSKSYYIREALIEHLTDLEAVYLADHIREQIRKEREGEGLLPGRCRETSWPGGLRSPGLQKSSSEGSTSRLPAVSSTFSGNE